MSAERKPPRSTSEKDFLRRVKALLFFVYSGLVANLAIELIGNQANDTAVGQVLGKVLLVAAFVVGVGGIGFWLFLRWRDGRKGPDAVADRGPSIRPELPTWHRPTRLYDRDVEIERAVEVVLADRVVALAGPRDIGTSAVAEAVVDRLIEDHHADPDKTIRFDLRSRSSRRPDDARASAGRIVSAFGLDEPADDTEAVLANAGSRLAAVFGERYDVLMLDNVSAPEEVEWLVRQWPPGGSARLVLAGESAIGSMVDGGTVFIGELDLPGLRAIWDADTRVPDPSLRHRLRARLKGLRGGDTEDLDELLKACFGRPRAIKDFAREIVRPDSPVTLESLVAAVRSKAPVEGPLERVWAGMLEHVRDGLSPQGVWLLDALAELPVTALTRNAVAALRPEEDVLGPLEELRIRNLVQETGGRYRLPLEIRRAIERTRPEQDRREVALVAVPALLGHHAEQADLWAGRLGSGSAGATAGDWFHDAERTLRPLFGEDNYHDEPLLAAAIEDLARIADALEAWYLREQQSGGLLAVNDGLHTLGERANRPDLAGVAAIRMATAHRMAGRLGEAGAMLDIAAAHGARLREDQAAEVDVREHVERALLCMASVGQSDVDREDLAAVEQELARIVATGRTSARHLGATAALINLGALGLQRGRPADALAHLRLAEKLARERRDIGCEAQTIELQGVAMSFQAEELPDAVPLWQRAMGMFAHIGEEQGEARCLQHLGSAALVDPRVAGRLRDGRPTALSEREAAEVALPLLERAKMLRAGQPDTRLVDEYLDIAQRRLTSAL